MDNRLCLIRTSLTCTVTQYHTVRASTLDGTA